MVDNHNSKKRMIKITGYFRRSFPSPHTMPQCRTYSCVHACNIFCVSLLLWQFRQFFSRSKWAFSSSPILDLKVTPYIYHARNSEWHFIACYSIVSNVFDSRPPWSHNTQWIAYTHRDTVHIPLQQHNDNDNSDGETNKKKYCGKMNIIW